MIWQALPEWRMSQISSLLVESIRFFYFGSTQLNCWCSKGLERWPKIKAFICLTPNDFGYPHAQQGPIDQLCGPLTMSLAYLKLCAFT